MRLDPLAIAGGVTVVLAAVSAAFVAGRWVVRLLRRLGHLADDIMGEPARPEMGQEERPGLMRRLANIEEDERAVREELRQLGRRLDNHLDFHAGVDWLTRGGSH